MAGVMKMRMRDDYSADKTSPMSIGIPSGLGFPCMRTPLILSLIETPCALYGIWI
jgi:hypothetical protein